MIDANDQTTKKIAIWGTGKIASEFMAFYKCFLRDKLLIVAFIDTYKSGYFYDKAIISPENYIPQDDIPIVVLTNRFFDIKKIVEEKYPFLSSQLVDYKEYIEPIVDIVRAEMYDKSAVFYGYQGIYELFEYRAKWIFRYIDYVGHADGLKDKKFDYVFLSTNRLIDGGERDRVEKDLTLKLRSEGISSTTRILSLETYSWFFKFDIRVKKEKKNDKTCYIIIVSDPIRGWGNLLSRVAKEISYARKMNWIPIVDFQNMRSMYIEKGQIGEVNAWDSYFEPVSEISLKQAYSDYNIVISGVDFHDDEKPELDCIILNPKTRK